MSLILQIHLSITDYFGRDGNPFLCYATLLIIDIFSRNGRSTDETVVQVPPGRPMVDIQLLPRLSEFFF